MPFQDVLGFLAVVGEVRLFLAEKPRTVQSGVPSTRSLRAGVEEGEGPKPGALES